MKQIERYIPIAIDLIDDFILKDTNVVAPEWDNCVSNFGAAMRQMGMLTAVTAFSNDSERSKVSKRALMHCLLRIMLLEKGSVLPAEQDLLTVVRDNPNDKIVQKQIIDATIAMKLALRLFIDNPYNEDSENQSTMEETKDGEHKEEE